MAELTPKQRSALVLVAAGGPGGISADDPRADQFSDDGDPDTWNQLFRAGLAKQWSVGMSGDEHALRITEAGRQALEARHD